MSSSLTTPCPVEPAVALSQSPLPDLLAAIPDHRKARGQRHQLPTLLSVGVAAVATGAKSFTAMESGSTTRPPPPSLILVLACTDDPRK
ncbi:transposase family protein [Corynebacterium variabile]|uniref:transposase family protein n=1 Tax=Corynebacterium variabile TaxID=1727 RepID=UPI003FD04CFF